MTLAFAAPAETIDRELSLRVYGVSYTQPKRHLLGYGTETRHVRQELLSGF